MIVNIHDIDPMNKREAEEFSSSLGGELKKIHQSSATSEYSLDLSFDSMYDGNSILEDYPDNTSAVLEFEDGTTAKHFVRKTRYFDCD